MTRRKASLPVAPIITRVGKMARRLPPLANRDARIRELSGRVRTLTSQVSELRSDGQRLQADLDETRELLAAGRLTPSLGARMHADRRIFLAARRLIADDTPSEPPRRTLMQKLQAYEFAQSHGILVPEVFGVWDAVDEIEWEDLPDAFVLKSATGSSSQGVYPLRRVPGGFQVVGRPGVRTARDLTGALARKHSGRKIGSPFFAEELLEEAHSPGTLPTDIKAYSFYGTVGHVLLRQVNKHGDAKGAQWQYVDREGNDLGDVAQGRSTSAPLPTYPRHAEFVRIAETLSAAVPTPMVRVDLYDTPKGVHLGELTVLPGGDQVYRDEHDRRLGQLWEQAEARLQVDLANGRPYALLYGDHPVTVKTSAKGHH